MGRQIFPIFLLTGRTYFPSIDSSTRPDTPRFGLKPYPGQGNGGREAEALDSQTHNPDLAQSAKNDGSRGAGSV